jgi:hypothetical protein
MFGKTIRIRSSEGGDHPRIETAVCANETRTRACNKFGMVDRIYWDRVELSHADKHRGIVAAY